METKIYDIFNKLSSAEAKREETIMLLQQHGMHLTPTDLAILMYRFGRAENLSLDDYTATLFHDAMKGSIQLNKRQLALAISVLAGVEESSKDHSSAVENLITIFYTQLHEASRLSPSFSSIEVSKVLFSLRTLNPHSPPALRLLQWSLRQLSSRGKDASLMDGQAVSMSLYGLGRFKGSVPEVRDLLYILANELQNDVKEMNLQGLAMCLNGLQRKEAELPQVRTILQVVASRLLANQEDMNERSLSLAMQGLQQMRADTSEVTCLLTVISSKIWRSRRLRLSSLSIGTCLLGMQRMRSNVPEVRTLLHALTVNMSTTAIGPPLTMAALRTCFYALHEMPFNTEVLALFNLFTLKLNESLQQLRLGQENVKSVCAILYSLQSRDDSVAEVKTLLTTLTHLASMSQERSVTVPLEMLTNGLYGFQRMRSSTLEVRKLLDSLGRIDISPLLPSTPMDSLQSITRAVFGLRNCTLSPEWTRLLTSWLNVILIAIESSSPSHIRSQLPSILLVFADPLSPLARSAKALGLEWIWHRIVSLLHMKVMPIAASEGSVVRSPTELRFSRLIREALQEEMTSLDEEEGIISFGCYLYGFEADIVWRRHNEEEDSTIVNIEIDGLAHSDLRKQYFCELRDKYLATKYNVKVLRLDVMKKELQAMNPRRMKMYLFLKLREIK